MPTPLTDHDLPPQRRIGTAQHANDRAAACFSAALGRMRSVLLMLIGILGLLASPWNVAAVTVIPSHSQRTQLTLTGTWSVGPVPDGGQLPVNIEVPGNVPVTGGTLRWTRTFVLNLDASPGVAWLEFGGVANRGVVRLNGAQVGTLEAFTRTRLDVRATLVTHGENRLEVDLDDRLGSATVPGAEIEPLVAQLGALAYTLVAPWEPQNGIVRDVLLGFAPRAVIRDVFAEPRLGATDTFIVRVRVTGAVSDRTRIAVGLLDGEQRVTDGLATRTGPDMFEITLSVPQATRWSPSHPHLYNLIATLAEDAVIDAVFDRVGLRTIKVKGNRFELNGTPLFLRGVTRHDLYGARGFVVDPDRLLEDFQRMKSLGINFVRTIHYPPDERFVRMADAAGILVSEEIPAWARIGNPSVVATARDMMTSLVERDFNRASVIAWLTGTGADHDALRTYFPAVAAAVRALDTSRPVSYTFDDSADTPAAIAANGFLASATGMDFLSQAGYWDAPTVQAIAPTLPTTLPVLIAEWSGSEGSNRGPVGNPGFTGLGVERVDPEGRGVMTEQYQAQSLARTFQPWLPFLLSGAPAVAGFTYYNWQDVPWSGAALLFQGHHPALRNGLYYEDRAPKLSVQVFEAVMKALQQIDGPALGAPGMQ